MKRFLIAAWFCFLNAAGLPSLPRQAAGQTTEITPEAEAFFESKIRPVLIKECYSCHSNQTGNAKGGLKLDTKQSSLLGGSSGPAVVPGNLDESLLYNALNHQDFAMPPRGKLSESVIADFRRWIEMGAPDPRNVEVGKLNSTITPEDIARAKASFWAYQTPQRIQATEPQNRNWARNDIDRFVLSKLEEQSLAPNADAAPQALIRRLSYDLIGLPPTYERTVSFAQAWDDNADEAVASLVEELLNSPQFGERWGRHWLDLARYAESNGREVNMTHPHAWRYRDYVIDAFNNDLPYDRFVQQQLAGDLLPVSSDEQWAQNLIATTFLALGPKPLSEQNRLQFMSDLIDEQVDVVTRVFLGTSVACARCHDHKFDPIPQSDYYALAGIFASTQTYFGPPASEFGSVGGIQNRNTSSLILLPINDPNPFDKSYTKDERDELVQQMRDLRRELVEARTAIRSAGTQGANPIANLIRTQARMESLSSLLGSTDQAGKPLSLCMGVQERDEPRDIPVLVRGEIDQPAHLAKRGFPQVLCSQPATIAPASSGRLELARWITAADNPLTSRVMANRVWQQLMGRGIVATPEDFGATGQAPSHPALLDHLATRLVDDGWSIKSLIRYIANSRTYRLSSQYRPDAFEADPENQWRWRANPRRLDAEAMRDSMLFVSGQLTLERPRASEIAKVGYMQVRDGNLFSPNQLPGGMLAAGPPRAFPRMLRAFRSPESDRVDMLDATYRSLYLPIVRDELPRALEVFDFAEPSMVIGIRETSNTPNQSLFMLNNPFVLRQSEALARRINTQSGTNAERVERAYQLAYGRRPTADELEAVRRFVMEFTDASSSNRASMSTLTAICQSLLAAAEFRFID